MTIRHGWHLFVWRQMEDQLVRLLGRVRELKAHDPDGYRRKVQTRLLAALLELMEHRIPSNPAADDFRQGNTLGSAYRHWRRAKFFGRYRLFFRYSSTHRVIVYVWVNDEKTQRKRGDSKDPYVLFRRGLERGEPPDDFELLLHESGDLELPNSESHDAGT